MTEGKATPLTRDQWLAECGKLARIYEESMIMDDTDRNEQSLADIVEQINTLLDTIGERMKMQPTELIVPAATVQQVADEHGITVEEAKEYLREVARQLVWSSGTTEGDGLDLIRGK